MTEQKERRIKRVRAKISGTAERPRLAVFRSAKHIYGQMIDDENGVTLAAVSSQEVKTTEKIEEETGKLLATKALQKKIKKAVFDRRSYQYHGRVKSFADGVRAGGVEI